LAIDITRLEKLSQIAAARGLLIGKQFVADCISFPSKAQREAGVQFPSCVISSGQPAHSHSEFNAGVWPAIAQNCGDLHRVAP
jgi:hypothetical protein